MSDRKLTVGILFGGQSAEHEVSIQSARNIYNALNREKYRPALIYIDKQGRWLGLKIWPQTETDWHRGQSVVLLPGGGGQLLNLTAGTEQKLDVIFPVLHGPKGEDGTIQGLVKLAGAPLVGSGVLGSAVGMDKDVMKRLLNQAGLPVGQFLVYRRGEIIDGDEVVTKLGLPLFVKPANLGSSIGISKVKNKTALAAAAAEAFQYDEKILIEEFTAGREIECAILGNNQPQASMPGEIIVQDDFYSYDAKYVAKDGAVLVAPAKLDHETVEKIQALAIKIFQVLSAQGLARLDFFLQADGRILINEINTMPGFTAISMYPRLWAESGLKYPELVDRLIQLALERGC